MPPELRSPRGAEDRLSFRERLDGSGCILRSLSAVRPCNERSSNQHPCRWRSSLSAEHMRECVPNADAPHGRRCVLPAERKDHVNAETTTSLSVLFVTSLRRCGKIRRNAVSGQGRFGKRVKIFLSDSSAGAEGLNPASATDNTNLTEGKNYRSGAEDNAALS